jgi:DNA-binding CsgD family transcriptional regulator
MKNLARIALDEGDLAGAADLYAESLARCWQQADRTGSLGCLRGVADVALAAERHAEAARFLAATQALGEAVGSAPAGAARERFERVIGQAQAGLGQDDFAAAWAVGRASSIEQVISDARSLAAELAATPAMPVVRTPSPGIAVAGLSPREIEVLRLIAAGLPTAEIAEQLYLSPRTVTTHLASIYNKLGFNSRSAATRFAIEHGLI